ncbi:MAG: methyltransferase type 11 [Halobacteriovorax sp.]|nr:methyltransferase type 11 [Halobacteriovorax sp.]|tara:strand:- start:98689 stop:99756 length:1068 start_codon:yes stop_codon:yes gene_type:complete
MTENNQKNIDVQEYYGKVLQKSDDLKTNACCTIVKYPDHIRETMSLIHDEVMEKYYGCGLTIPQGLKDCKVLDLGSGSGRDCYLMSRLVGENGEVVGVDMTDEQLDVARRHEEYHAKQFGYSKPNTKFLKGYIEKLDELNLEDNYFDVIASNCVINLSPDKEAVLREAYRVLKPGGELYFSDVYSDRRVPEHLQNDEVLWGECLSGALYWNDFLAISKKVGFLDPRTVEIAPITIESKEVEEKVGDIKFYSITYRLFKLPELESACEDYGQSVVYKGTVEYEPNIFVLDGNHAIEKGVEFKICGNSWRMLEQSRFKKHFDYNGNFEKHLGIFEGCGGESPLENIPQKGGNGGSCC